jgi:glutathione S-transferase
VRRHEGLKQIYGEAPTAVESAKGYFLHNLEAIVPKIERRSPYLFGDWLSAADILLMTCLDWAAAESISIPETLGRYQKRIALRPAYQAALSRNFAAFQGRQ